MGTAVECTRLVVSASCTACRRVMVTWVACHASGSAAVGALLTCGRRVSDTCGVTAERRAAWLGGRTSTWNEYHLYYSFRHFRDFCNTCVPYSLQCSLMPSVSSVAPAEQQISSKRSQVHVVRCNYE